MAISTDNSALYDGQEIDLLEYKNGQLAAFEFKWQRRRVRILGSFEKAYPRATFEVVDQENYPDFIVSSLNHQTN